MGTWGAGPFDSDCAAEFGEELDELPIEERAGAIRGALEDVIREEGYLDAFEGVRGVAAAALVAVQCSGGPSADSVYGPDGPVPELPVDLRPLAVKVLDRVLAPESELREFWDEVDGREWVAEIDRLRVPLAASSN